jgi:hypothetical protein
MLPVIEIMEAEILAFVSVGRDTSIFWRTWEGGRLLNTALTVLTATATMSLEIAGGPALNSKCAISGPMYL